MGDETCITSHQLHYADAVVGRCRLGVCRVDHCRRHLNRCVEAEGVVDERDIVVDSLGNTSKANNDSAFDRSLHQPVDTSVRAITANNVDLVHALLHETIQHLVSIKAATARPQDRPSLLVDVLDTFRRQLDPIVCDIGVDALVAPLDPVDLAHLVAVVQSHDKFADDDIETGAESSTGQNHCLGLSWVVEELLSGTRLDKFDRLGDVFVARVLLGGCHEGVITKELLLGEEARATKD